MRLFNATVLAPLIALFPVLLAATSTFGCAAANAARSPGGPGGAATAGATTSSGAIAAADAVDPMQGAPKDPLPWADFSPATFAKAKAEGRFVVMDGSAEWCHWCHVMEATTYHDPAIKKILAEHFVQVKVDIDSRPDLEERYGDYGWPATVIFSPDAEELGKYRGYISPDKFGEILRAVVEAKAEGKTAIAQSNDSKPAKGPLPEEEIAWIHQFTILELDEYYDETQGGWGRSQKAPLAWDNAWALARAKAGDSSMRAKALFTLDQQRKLIDPVWGGIYQYSASTDWDHPHFEKLMPYEAGALDNYAAAYALTHESKYADAARAMRGYIDSFLKGADGGFYATQDADLNAHRESLSATKRFMSGHDYYAKSDGERRALGIPRVDTHEYAKDNGLAIAAYVTLFEATQDATALVTAQKAADRILASHASGRGGLTHDVIPEVAPKSAVLYLGDNASMGFALMRLYEATKKPEALEAATRIADFMMKELYDEAGGGFFAQTIDPDAVGVFANRRKPFEENVMAIRFLAKRARANPSAANAAYAKGIAGAIRAIATPEQIKNRGRILGDFLLALEESQGAREGR